MAAPAQWILRSSQTADQRFVAGLRQRRLFDLAVAYCRQRLERPDLAARARAELVVELARTHALAAVTSAGAARAAHWQQAEAVAADYATAFPDSPYLVLVQHQDALTWLARGELARQQTPADPAADWQHARETLRQAIRKLRAVDRQVRQRLVDRRRTAGTGAEQLTEGQLDSRAHQVAHQLARALRNQGLCYPAESADRANSLTQAIEVLTPLAEATDLTPLVWQSRLDRVACVRLLEQGERAQVMLDALAKAKPPPEIAARVQAERIRLLLSQGKLDEAQAKAALRQETPVLETPVAVDLELARLETTLALWQRAAAAGQAKRGRELVEQATAQVRRIEHAYGPYWSHQADALLADLATAPAMAADPAALVRAADGLLRNGNEEGALEVYDRAAAAAAGPETAGQAFDAAFKAATIVHNQGQHEDARRRYEALALAHKDLPRAAEAHLLAAYHAACLVRSASGPEQARRVEQYEQLLQDQRRLWPDSPTADQAGVWLGGLYESQRKWPEAIAAYRSVRRQNNSWHDQAIEHLARCYEKWLEQPRADRAAQRGATEQALRDLRVALLGDQNHWPQTWSPALRRVATSLARILLQHTRDAAVQAGTVLSQALAGPPQPPPSAWETEARWLLAVAWAGQGKLDEARHALKTLAGASPERLLEAADLLLRISRRAGDSRRKELAALALVALERHTGQDTDLGDERQRRLERLRADALAQAGRRAEALAVMTRLAERFPADGGLQEACARLLAEAATGAEALAAARARWRQVEQGSPPASPRWFRARYARAQLYFRAGDRTRCAKLIELTQVLHPEMGGPAMKKQFLELLAQCR